jgi:hypothetical protein
MIHRFFELNLFRLTVVSPLVVSGHILCNWIIDTEICFWIYKQCTSLIWSSLVYFSFSTSLTETVREHWRTRSLVI